MTLAIGILIILIILNGFFAASEIALVSLNENKVQRMASKGDKKAKKIYDLISEPSRFLSTIQIGITLAGFLASAFAADFFAEPLAETLYEMGIPASQAFLETFSTIVITIVLSYFTLVFGELVPKQLALQKAEAISNLMVTPLTVLFKVCLPIVKFLSFSTDTIVRLFGVDPNAQGDDVSEEDIRMMVDDGGERGTIQKTEKQMINNIFEFNDKSASNIITHRTDMTALSADASLTEVIQLVNAEKYTRFPVYGEDLDDIIGILHSKDLIQFLENPVEGIFQLSDIVREPYFVLEAQKLDVIFRDMQHQNLHIAVVLDEYGGTEGIITIEDIIEEIVGDIFSENARIDTPVEEIQKLTPSKFSISGTCHLHEVESQLEISLPTDDFDTLSGFLIDQLGYIPNIGEQPVINYKDIQFEVDEVADKRIAKVTATIEYSKKVTS